MGYRSDWEYKVWKKTSEKERKSRRRSRAISRIVLTAAVTFGIAGLYTCNKMDASQICRFFVILLTLFAVSAVFGILGQAVVVKRYVFEKEDEDE